MQAQEATLTTTDHLFRLLPWFEANLKRIAYGVAIALVAAFVFFFYSYRQNQQEIAAGQALTQALMLNDSSQRAAACLKIIADYSGTLAGQRALIEAGTALFTAGRYADAQAEFQKYLDANPDGFFTPQAALGVAASLDALGQTDPAMSAYQKAAGQAANANVVASAKFSLARMDEAQGKFADATMLYSEVARAGANTSLGYEAGLRAMELKAKLPATPAAPAPAASMPFNLSH